MKIYFAGSIRGGRNDQETYFAIIKELQNYGEVLTEHVGAASLTSFGENNFSEENIYTRDMSWLREADVVVAEVSTPSLGVGYEIGKAEDIQKPILCLYRETEGKRCSAMLTGNNYLTVAKYTDLENAKKIIEKFLKK